MKQAKNGTQTRLLIAITLIVTSFVSAFLLSKAANQTQLVWSARSVLSPGSRISAEEIILKKVAFPNGERTYVPQKLSIINFRVLREIGAGELIPAVAVSNVASISRRSEVPISVLNSDSPSGLQIGQIVNIYHVGDPHLTQNIGPPVLILSHIHILGIDNKSQNLGGNLSLTLSVDLRSILSLLRATSSGRIVIVRVDV